MATDDRSRDLRIVDPMPTLARLGGLAADARHSHIGTEHLAILALPGPDGIEAMVAEAGIDPAPLRHALETCCTMIETDDEPRITPRTAALLAVASQLAMADGSGEIQPLHLAFVLLGVPDAIAWRGLGAVGATRDVIADGIQRRNRRSAPSLPN